MIDIQMNYKSILSKNVAALMDRSELLGSHAKLAAHCRKATRKISARAIGYLLDPEDARQPKLDTIVAVAEAFKVAPWLLLTVDFDPDKKMRAELPPPEIIDLARRILQISEPERDLLMKIFSKTMAEGTTQEQRVPALIEQPTKAREYTRAAKRKR